MCIHIWLHYITIIVSTPSFSESLPVIPYSIVLMACNGDSGKCDNNASVTIYGSDGQTNDLPLVDSITDGDIGHGGVNVFYFNYTDLGWFISYIIYNVISDCYEYIYIYIYIYIFPYPCAYAYTYALEFTYAYGYAYAFAYSYVMTEALTDALTHALTHALTNALANALAHALSNALAYVLPHALARAFTQVNLVIAIR